MVGFLLSCLATGRCQNFPLYIAFINCHWILTASRNWKLRGLPLRAFRPPVRTVTNRECANHATGSSWFKALHHLPLPMSGAYLWFSMLGTWIEQGQLLAAYNTGKLGSRPSIWNLRERILPGKATCETGNMGNPIINPQFLMVGTQPISSQIR